MANNWPSGLRVLSVVRQYQPSNRPSGVHASIRLPECLTRPMIEPSGRLIVVSFIWFPLNENPIINHSGFRATASCRHTQMVRCFNNENKPLTQ